MANWTSYRGIRLRELDKAMPLSGVFPVLDFSLNPAEISRLTQAFSAFPGAIQGAMLKAADRTRQATRNELVRAYKNLVTLKPAYIGRGIKGKKARMSGGGAVAEIRIATRAIPLGRYAIKPETPPRLKGVAIKDRPRVHYKLRNGGRSYGDTPKSQFAGAGNKLFVTRMASGHIGAFARVGRKPYGIVQEMGPSLQYHAHAEGFLPHIEDFSRARLKAAFVEEARKITGIGA